MTERAADNPVKRYEPTDPYEQDKKVQQAFDEYREMGIILSALRVSSAQTAFEMAHEVNSRLITKLDKSVDLTRTSLLVSGESVRKANFYQQTDDAGISMVINKDNPRVPLEFGEERLMRPRSLRAMAWEDSEAGCWRIGLRMHGNDASNAYRTTINVNDQPLFDMNVSGYLEVALDWNAQVNVDALVKKNERDESIANLRGHFNNGIVRQLKAVDQEMTMGSPNEYSDLKRVQNLRVLGRYGMTITDLNKADLLNTAIAKVLNRSNTHMVFGGAGYDTGQAHPEDGPMRATISGVVADVINEVPVDTNQELGPALVVVGSKDTFDNPVYMPIKDIVTVKY
ncbi:MAG TPA: hypothetical protein VF281_00315 [Candidatus Saccharimonadales bacterium]